MLDLGINGVVLRVKCKSLGDIGDISVMGKTLTDWVGSALSTPFKSVESSQVVNMCEKLRAAVDRSKPITVVLYCDTPLVSAKTVAAAVEQVRAGKMNALALARGFVFRTEYLFEIDTLFLQAPVCTEREFDTVTDGESLSRITDTIRRRILGYHASNGVIIPDFQNTYIDCDAIISIIAVPKIVIIVPAVNSLTSFFPLLSIPLYPICLRLPLQKLFLKF